MFLAHPVKKQKMEIGGFNRTATKCRLNDYLFERKRRTSKSTKFLEAVSNI